MAIFSIPLVSQYSFWTQFFILGTLIVASYLHRTTRVVVATGGTGLIVLKFLIPTVKLVIYLLKGLAWLGFYAFFIQYAITSGIGWLSWLLEDMLPWIINEMDKARMGSDASPPSSQTYGAPMEEVD